jgi:hypothetical protein
MWIFVKPERDELSMPIAEKEDSADVMAWIGARRIYHSVPITRIDRKKTKRAVCSGPVTMLVTAPIGMLMRV